MKDVIRAACGLVTRALNEEKRSIDVIASSMAVDAYGEIVAQDWDLKRYEANPVVLYGHNAWGFPIGHASNLRVEKGKLLATLTFVDARANPIAEQVWQGIVQGSLRAVSVGFRSKSAKVNEIDGRDVVVLSGNELLEISVVPIPANPEAVTVAGKSFDIIRSLLEGGAVHTEKKTMAQIALVTLAAILAMPGSATEADVLDKVKSLDRDAADRKKLLEALGVDNVEKALGAIAAGKQAIASNTELAKKNDDLERAQIISKAKEEKKLSPHQENGLEGKSLDFVKQFIELQHPNPTLAKNGDDKESTGSGGVLTHNGKGWGELTPGEKHTLYFNNHALYTAMRESAQN